MRFLAPFILSLLFGLNVYAAESGVMQWGADESSLDRKTHVVKLTGNAYLFRDQEVLKADSIRFNSETELVHAEGRIQYQYGEYYVRADALDLDLKKKTGTIINGNISNGRFALRGSTIDQVEPNHFKVKDFDYSTCYDCPNAWALTGTDVDMTIEGYAYLQNFSFKIKDTPLIWFPYMVVPIKTKRQSGLLFPRFGRSEDFGYYFVEPYYWAINHNADMTIGVGDYTKDGRGFRFELEGRYALSPRSQGSFNYYWTKDAEVGPLYYRWAARSALTQELPFGFEGKLRLNEVSDSGYPIRYGDDITGRQQSVLTSDLFFSRNDPDFSTTISFRRIRNLLKYDGLGNPDSGFDPLTVQEFPRVVLSANDKLILDQKVGVGIETRFNRFTRTAGPFDNFIIGKDRTDIIREANRLTVIPNVYTTVKPFPWLSIVPSMQYRSFFYNFSGVYSNLARGYLLAQADASIQLEKQFQTSDPGISFRSTIRPFLTYSNIPDWGIIQSSDHPFVQQVQNVGGAGLYFDDSDIVPQKTIQNLDNYFLPLGNSLTYGLTTQLFRREKQADGSVRVSRRFEAGFNQTLDIYEATRALNNIDVNNRVILSPLVSHFIYETAEFSAGLEYTYYAFLERYNAEAANLLQPVERTSPHRIVTSFTWTLESALKDRILKYERSFSLSYSFARLTSKISSLQLSSNFSVNDYLMPKGAISYNLVSDASPHLIEVSGGLLFQSPSKCWQAEVGLAHSIDQNSSIKFNVALNLSGDSFGGLDDTLKK